MGLFIIRLLLPHSTFGVSLGLAILVGGSVLSSVALGFVSLGFDGRWAVLLFLIVLVSVGMFKSGSAAGWSILKIPAGNSELLFRSVGIGIFGTNWKSLPTMAVGASLLLLPQAGLVRVERLIMRRMLTSVLVGLGGAVAFGLAKMQPQWRFSNNNDGPFFEALSWTLTHFGLGSHPGYLNGDIYGYHVLAYVWPGVMTLATGAPPFVMLNLVLPFLAAVSLALLLLSSAERGKTSSPVNLVLVTTFVSIFGSGLIASASFGTWALIAYVVALLHTDWHVTTVPKRLTVLRRETLLGVLGVIAILGKGTSLGLIGLLSAAPLFHVIITSTPRHLRLILRNVPIHLPVVMLTTALWYAPAKLSRNDPSPLSNISNLGLNEGLWVSRDLLEFGPVLLLTGLVAVVILFRDKITSGLQLPLLLLAVTNIGSAVAGWFLPGRLVRSNLAQHAFYVGLATIIIAVTRIKWSLPTTRRFILTAAISAPFAITLSIYFGFYLNSFIDNQPTLSKTRWVPELLVNAQLPLLLLVPLVVASFVSRRKIKTGAYLPANLMALSALILTLGSSTLIIRSEQLRSTRDPVTAPVSKPWATSLPDEATFQVGAWIRANTPTNSVLGSNSFCCWNDRSWTLSAYSDIQNLEKRIEDFGEDGFAGSNYLLASVTSRRFLLAGPRFVIGDGSDASTVLSYLRLSADFGSQRTTELGRSLRMLGVDFFIFDKLVPSHSNVPVTPIFENTRYLVVEL